MTSSGGGQLLSLEKAWLRLMRVVGFTNPVRARQSDIAVRAINSLMARKR